jgi:hypothetical protein
MAEFFIMYCTGGPEWRGEGGEKKLADKYVTAARRTGYLKDLFSVRCSSCKPKAEKEKRREERERRALLY